MNWVHKATLAVATALVGTFVVPASPAAAAPPCSLDIQSPHAEQTGALELLTATDRFHCAGLAPNTVYLATLTTWDVAHEAIDVFEDGLVETQNLASDATGNLDGFFEPAWYGAPEPAGTPNTMNSDLRIAPIAIGFIVGANILASRNFSSS